MSVSLKPSGRVLLTSAMRLSTPLETSTTFASERFLISRATELMPLKREVDVIVSMVSFTTAISESLTTPFSVGISMLRISSRFLNLPAVRTDVFLCLPITSPIGRLTLDMP